jgi:hypothetical protein
MRTQSLLGATALGLILLLPISATAQQVYKNVSSDKIERILGDLNIEYKKSKGNKDGIHFYDFTRNGFKVRLHNYNGQDLWIDALFTDPMSPEDANRWNIRAKFSRVVLMDVNGKKTVSLENQFDCAGGCTDPIVRQFVNRFDNEVQTFADYVKNSQPR